MVLQARLQPQALAIRVKQILQARPLLVPPLNKSQLKVRQLQALQPLKVYQIKVSLQHQVLRKIHQKMKTQQRLQRQTKLQLQSHYLVVPMVNVNAKVSWPMTKTVKSSTDV